MKRITVAVLLLTVTITAFGADDKKVAEKKVTDKKVATAKNKKKELCCESGIPSRFTAAGAKVLKKPAAHK